MKISAMDDETYAEHTLAVREVPQPESLERFVRAARKEPKLWAAAAANALAQREQWRRER